MNDIWDQLAAPGKTYLADFSVIVGLLRDYAGKVLNSEPDQLKDTMSNGALDLAKILLGKNKAYSAPPWFSPGQIDVYLAKKIGVASDVPEERVAAALVNMCGEFFDLGKQISESNALAEQWQPAVKQIIQNYAQLIMGIPEGF